MRTIQRLRLLAEASGLKFDWIWDEEKCEFVLSDPEVKRLWEEISKNAFSGGAKEQDRESL